MTLRTFHLIFILFAIMGADLYGGWAVHEYRTTGDLTILGLGIASMVGGLGLAGYAIRFVRIAEQAHLR